ncbi:MAG: [acyl-carrier-protein] S-malonyltransferase [Candidatus Omnitrophica bacterium 4484_213]|nr:MAG: [acyl-carrier-protein] S-malonyltransferase [Candidatus Omnitrophica bacterium 4484_213]
MVNIAFVFPGQGAQYVGMGKEFYDNFSCAKAVFEETNEILGFDLARLCFEGPEEDLKRTLNSQLAIFTTSIASWKVIQENFNLSPMLVAGLSLGEYTALVVAQSLSFEQGLVLVQKRAQFMEEACQERASGMVSIIDLTQEEVEEISRKGGAEIANLNCPGQIVVSAELKNLKKVIDLVKQKKGKAIILKTNGGFHSSLMNSAAKKLEKELEKTEISPAKIPIVSNFSVNLETSPEEIKRNLVNQVNHRTCWQGCVQLMLKRDVNTFLEIGPGKVLTKFLTRIASSANGYNVERVKDLEKLKERQ